MQPSDRGPAREQPRQIVAPRVSSLTTPAGAGGELLALPMASPWHHFNLELAHLDARTKTEAATTRRCRRAESKSTIDHMMVSKGKHGCECLEHVPRMLDDDSSEQSATYLMATTSQVLAWKP